MNTTKILETEIEDLKISSLPARPTAPSAFGGRGYTAKDMKAAFDRLPLFIIERFNSLLDDVTETGDGSLAADIPTGISDAHTLRDLFSDVLTGAFAAYLSLGDESLSELRERLEDELLSANEKIAVCLLHIADRVLDADTPSVRGADGEVMA